jgi:anti-sigma factor RsiW
MNTTDTITDADLHAYVDGELSPERQRLVEAWLARNPEDAARVADYRRLNQGLRALFPADEVSTPAGPQRARTFAPFTGRIAAAMAWVCLGGAIGWLMHAGMEQRAIESTMVSQDLVRPAAFAHQVYSTEIIHPVEVAANQEEHLESWLSKRLKAPIHAPSLNDIGYQLVGGRLLPSTDRMAAQFMFQNAQGQRITLYIRRGAWQNETTAFRFAQEDSVGTFYWIDGPMGYALSGDLDRTQLLKIAEFVYRRLNS